MHHTKHCTVLSGHACGRTLPAQAAVCNLVAAEFGGECTITAAGSAVECCIASRPAVGPRPPLVWGAEAVHRHGFLQGTCASDVVMGPDRE